jgi:transcriptional regulator with XRE-family HTH domain
MTPEEAQRLADLLRTKREAAGLSASEVARRAGVNVGTVTRIELGQIPSPRPDSLRAIGDVLDIPAADLFAATDWLHPAELPTFRPYLRTKYRDLPPEAIDEIAAVFDRLARDFGQRGPADGEDEHD